jgi:hypothetical protein
LWLDELGLAVKTVANKRSCCATQSSVRITDLTIQKHVKFGVSEGFEKLNDHKSSFLWVVQQAQTMMAHGLT